LSVTSRAALNKGKSSGSFADGDGAPVTSRSALNKGKSYGSLPEGDDDNDLIHSSKMLFEAAGGGGGGAVEREKRKRQLSIESRASGLSIMSGVSSTRSSFDSKLSAAETKAGGAVGPGGDDAAADNHDHPDHVVADPDLSEAQQTYRDSEVLDQIWTKVNERLLVPPYVPKLSNDKAGDDRYFRDCYNEPADNSLNSSNNTSSPFDGF
jgi:hypothetical protein